MSNKEFPEFREWAGWWKVVASDEEIEEAVKDTFIYARYNLAKSVHALKWAIIDGLPAWLQRYLGY